MWTALPLEKSRSPATVNKLSKPRHNSRTKLCIELSLIHNRDNVELYLHCKFQSSPFSVRRKNGVTDRQNDRQPDYSMPRGSAHRGIMKHLRCRCLGDHYPPFHKHSNCRCMHTGFLYSSCFSYAIRSQSVLTTIQLGVSTVFSAAVIPRAR